MPDAPAQILKPSKSPWLAGAQVGFIEHLLPNRLIRKLGMVSRVALEFLFCALLGLGIFSLLVAYWPADIQHFWLGIQLATMACVLLTVRPMGAVYKRLPTLAPNQRWLWQIVAGLLPMLACAAVALLSGAIIQVIDPTFVNLIMLKENRLIFYPLVIGWIGASVGAKKGIESAFGPRSAR